MSTLEIAPAVETIEIPGKNITVCFRLVLHTVRFQARAKAFCPSKAFLVHFRVVAWVSILRI